MPEMSSLSPSIASKAMSLIAAGSTAPAAMGQLALGQQMALEHHVDRLQIEFGGHVADRAIFVVEFLGRLGAFASPSTRCLNISQWLMMCVAEVHGHEAGELEEARIDLPPRAWIDHRHGGDDIVLEPADGRSSPTC